MHLRWAAKPPIHETPVQPPSAAAPDEKIRAQVPPGRLTRDETLRLQQAAYQATRRYPDPVGELVANELWAWAELGARFDPDGLMGRVVKHLLAGDSR